MELATCKYCGQILTIELPENATHEQALEAGTLNCNCGMAREYQQMQERAATAKIELSDMLLQDDEVHNIKAVDKGIYDLLTTAIDIIAKDKIYKISVGLSSGGTVDIKAGTGGKISLKRSTALTTKREV